MKIRVCALWAFTTLLSTSLTAEESGVHFSAYITQGYSKTFLDEIEKERGDWSITLYALQLTAQINDSLSLRTELEGHDGLIQESILPGDPHTSLQPEIIVASAQYSLTDNLRFDVGLLKQPFSFYNEVRNVGIAYPFVSLPSVYQPVTGAMEENFRGAELQGNWYWGDIELDALVYFGQMNLFSFFDEKGEFDMDRFDFAEFKAATLPIKNIIGGQLIFGGAIDGLRLSAGGWTGWIYEGARETRWESWVLGLDWDHDWFLVNAEWNRVNDIGESYYGFLGAKLPWNVMLTGVIDRNLGDRSHLLMSRVRQWGVGAVWNIHPELALKVESLWVDQSLNIIDPGSEMTLFSILSDQRKVSVSLSAALF